MNAWATRSAFLATAGAALLVLLLFVPALHAPFLAPKFAALEVSSALGFVACALRRCSLDAPRWSRSITLGALLVLATTGVAWALAAGRPDGSPYALDALARWGSLLGLACGAGVVAEDPANRARLVQVITVAAAAVALLGLLQHAGVLPIRIPIISVPGSTFGNRNLAAEVMALTLPLGLALALDTSRGGLRTALVVATALELVYLAVTRARGAWLGAAVGTLLVVWLLRRALAPRARVAVAFVVVVAVAAAAIPGRSNARDVGDAKRFAGVASLFDGSFDARGTALRTRFGFWRRSLAMLREAPWTGVGPGNWPVVFPRFAEPDASADGVLSPTLAPRQAHDDLIERTVETGLPGGLALIAFVTAVAVAARRRIASAGQARLLHVGAAGSLLALAVVSLTSFPLEMPGTIALGGIALGLVAAEPGPAARTQPSRGSYAVTFAAAVLLLFVGVRAERLVRGSYWLGVAERALQKDGGRRGAEEALPALSRAFEATPRSFLAALRTAQMELREHHARAAILAATLATSIEPNSPNGWATLGQAHLAARQTDDAQHDAARALSLLHDYPLALRVKASAEAQTRDQTLDQTVP